MDKRTITALLMMLVLYLAFDTFVWKPQRQAAMQANMIQPQETPTIADSSDVSEIPPVTSIATSDTLLGKVASTTSKLSLENEHIKVQFDSKGAMITSIELKNFKYNESQLVDLIPEATSIAGTSVYYGSNSTDLSNTAFNYEQDAAGKSVTFYLGELANPTILKRYVLDDRFGISLDVEVQNLPSINGIRLDFQAGIADSEENTKSKNQDYRFFLNADNNILKVPLSKLRKNQPQGSFGSFAWMAVRSKYFTLALREIEPPLSRSFNTVINPDTANPGFSLDSFNRSSKQSWKQSFVLYAGPADSDILKDYGRQMENIAERGANWLRWLGNIMAWFLNWLHGYISNYGVVLIILALVLKIVLHPLTHKSLTSSMKMQKIQPQLQVLQKKYKDDPKTLQLEMSKLYKEAGANPLSGCLPLLLQMPIFISLYNVLRYSLDMRNAGFVLWLTDLSEPDPYLILPIIMGVFMIIQSLMMQPKKANLDEMDEKQKAMQSSQKMMTWMMPIMMFFIFRNMPAGLVLYWTTFNIFSVIQQYYLMKHYKNKDFA
ncbi:MAG: membrane protein insertase YidC [Candidatus Cloacimonadaceae bacterium]|nr:membrane protein insertase YidC [Candidatus Cloacimonadota bacterium]